MVKQGNERNKVEKTEQRLWKASENMCLLFAMVSTFSKEQMEWMTVSEIYVND